jgi:competence protein ComEC
VVDAGPRSSLLEYLRQAGISEVHEIFVSHADADHIEGILALLSENIRIRSIRLNTDSLKDSDLWDDLLFEVEQRRLAGELEFHTALTSTDGPFVFGSATVTVLGPSAYLAARGPGSTDSAGKQITSNSISAVLRAAAGGTPGVLFTGDLDAIGLSDLERCKVSLSADVLVYPHHGGRSSSNDTAFAAKLARATDAKHVLFSIERAGRNSGNPRPEVVAAVRTALPSARIACTQLSSNCADADPNEDPTHLLPIYARGRATRACCAGSLVLDLVGGVTPQRTGHLAFIRKHARKSLCVS